MNLASRKPMTLAEFLAWEERQPLRYEFDGVGPVARTGGTVGHSAIQGNLAVSIGGRLRGKTCHFFGSNLKIQVAGGHIRYPDGMVVRSPVDREATVARDPVVVFEVLSPSTAAYDRIIKAREYQATPSIQRYVMLEQDIVGATVYRAGEVGRIDILVADSLLALPEIGVELRSPNSTRGSPSTTNPTRSRRRAGEPRPVSSPRKRGKAGSCHPRASGDPGRTGARAWAASQAKLNIRQRQDLDSPLSRG